MLRIGITGGIGSGKSLVSSMFGILGIPLYNSDERAKWLMAHDAGVKSKLLALFGKQVFTEHGQLNRAHIASRVFSDRAMLERLNSIVHPRVYEDFIEWSGSQEGKAPYVLKEAALIFEAGSNTSLDSVLLIWAPEEVRFQRVMDRDGTTLEDVKRRAANQWPDEKKLPLSDCIIINDGKRPLMRQVIEMHNIFSVKSGGNPIPCTTF